MNAEDLIRFAQKQADYESSAVSILKSGLDDTWKSALALDKDKQNLVVELAESFRDCIDQLGVTGEIAITIIAFEIQIKNAQDRSHQNNN